MRVKLIHLFFSRLLLLPFMYPITTAIPLSLMSDHLLPSMYPIAITTLQVY